MLSKVLDLENKNKNLSQIGVSKERNSLLLITKKSRVYLVRKCSKVLNSCHQDLPLSVPYIGLILKQPLSSW